MKSKVEEIAHHITYHKYDRLKNFRQYNLGEQSAAFELLSPYIQQTILSDLKEYEIVNLLDHMDIRHAEAVLARVKDVKRRARIIKKLKGDIREKAEFFLRFHPQASLSIMNFNYLLLPYNTTVGEAADCIDEHYDETGKYPEVLVREDGKLIGEVLFSTLVRERNSHKIKRYIRPVTTIMYHTEVSKIVETLISTKSKKVVVLDRDYSVIGLMYADNIKSLLGKLPAEALYDFAGVDNSEQPFDSIKKKVTNRYRWLILNLFTAFGAGGVVILFQDTLNALTILSVYIPIIAGMGGNAATQSFAIMVRGLTLGTISLHTAAPALYKELIAGALNGVIIGGIVTVVTTLWNGDPLLGLSVGLALIGAHAVAAVAGAIVPLIMKEVGKDPASTSSIFITTATDIIGLVLLLGIATLVFL